MKHLWDEVPDGFLVDSKWLRKHAISRQLAHKYVERGWLQHVAHGLFRRPHAYAGVRQDADDWLVPVLSAQWIMGYDVHVGGPTALALGGYRHYLPLGGRDVVYLYADRLPTWFARLPVHAHLRHRKKTLFDDPALGVEHAELESAAEGRSVTMPWAWPLKASSAERAILEALDELPDEESFHVLDTMFEGLANLRPRRLSALLESCRSVQVKRLFFVFADKHTHAWRKYVHPEDVDLGSGDRAFTQGGRLHPDYGITVPPEFLPRDEEGEDGT